MLHCRDHEEQGLMVDVPSLPGLRYCRQAECLEDSAGLLSKRIRSEVQ